MKLSKCHCRTRRCCHLVLRLQGKLRVFQTSAHFHFLSLPRGYCSKPSDPQHLRSMAVFFDTAKRLWGLYLFTRCSRPRVLTLRAGWNRLFIELHLPLLLYPFLSSTQLYLTSYRASWHLLSFPVTHGCGTPSKLMSRPSSITLNCCYAVSSD